MVSSSALKTIGALRSRNTSNTSSRKECKYYGAYKSVHYGGDDAIASQHKSMFSVQSHISQEVGQTTMVDNL